MENIITAKQLNKIYNEKVKAVNNVDLEIKRGCFYAIMGHSGSGKTTLLNLLGLLDKPSHGEIFIDGNPSSKANDFEKAEIRMRKFGFVFQSFFLNPKLKAYENVMLPMYINDRYQLKDMKQRALELLRSLNMEDRVNHFPKELSGGEQQRVAIARALANDPECIFADEPTGNLDVDNEKIVLDILKEQSRQGKTIVVVSHNDIVRSYADRVLHMNKGILEEIV